MTATYYRVHDTSRNRPEDLLLPENQVSRVWIGAVYRKCDACSGMGTDWSDEIEDTVSCDHCGGAGEIQIEQQSGVSACRSLDDLREYFADRGAYIDGDTVVVEMEGDEADDEDVDVDAAEGAVLIRPTRIVRTLPVTALAPE